MTILLMAGATLGIALLPRYEQIGAVAPLLLGLMRVLQGLAAGGELPGALVYTVESVPPTMRGTFAALVLASSCGSLVASLAAALLFLMFGDATVAAWAWRLPFGLGACLALVACGLRRSMRPTGAFVAARAQSNTVAPMPIKLVLCDRKLDIMSIELGTLKYCSMHFYT